MQRINRKILAKFDDVPICCLLEEFVEIADHIKLFRTDAELQPARDLPVFRHDKETRHEMNARFGLRSCRFCLLRRKKLQQSPGIARTLLLRLAANDARTAPRTHAILFLHEFEHCRDNMFARTIINLKRRTVTIKIFDISIVVYAEIDMVLLGTLHIGIIIIFSIFLKMFHAPVPIVAASTFICCIARHRADIDLAEQILFLRLCAPAHSMLK